MITLRYVVQGSCSVGIAEKAIKKRAEMECGCIVHFKIRL